MRQKIYIGSVEMDGDRLAMVPTVRVGFEDSAMPNIIQDARKLNPRTDLVNHSPTGFEWGYGGSGPAQLALAILADMFEPGKAIAYYQSFKSAFVVRQPQGRAWILKENEVRELCKKLDGWLETSHRKGG